MIVTLQISTAGAAFEDAPEQELARILRDLAYRYATGDLSLAAPRSHLVREVNGNGCGLLTHTQEQT